MQRFVRGQVWWCKDSYDAMNGEREVDTSDKQKLFNHIQKGMRPVLIISNDTGNKFSEILQVIPCTSAIEKTTLPTHCSFYINNIRNTFLCEQIKTVNKADLTAYLVTLNRKEMEEIERCSKISLGLVQPTEHSYIIMPIEDENGDDNTIIELEGN